ncbi:MAG TPA: hypothetical protein VLC95_03185 [Anaerolineae bacterium]|nr:hypothetical protein [Anaerolineae bacterium]
MKCRLVLVCVLIALAAAGCRLPSTAIAPSATAAVSPSAMPAISPSPVAIPPSAMPAISASPVAISPSATLAISPSPVATPGTPAAGPQIPGLGINYVYHGLERYQGETGGTAADYVALQNAKACDLGAGWIRSAGPGDPTSLHWPRVEPQPGVFDLSLHDARVQQSGACGVSLLGHVEFGVVPDFAQVAGTYFDDARYLEYLNAVVERYDGDGTADMPGLVKPIKFWEIGNEVVVQRNFQGTPADYAHVLEISYRAIKSSCPDCEVLIGGWIIGKRDEQRWQRSLDYFGQVLAAGGGHYFDIMNYHEYTPGGDFLTYDHVDGFRETMAKYGFQKPIWITEANTPLVVGGQQVATVASQAEDLVKRMVIAFDAGVEVFMWHGLDDVPNGRGVGLVDEEGNPKPTYYSFQLLAERIGGFSSVEKVDLRKDLFFYRFDIDGQVVHVLWSAAGETTLDLSGYFDGAAIELTHTITATGQSEPDIEVVSSESVPVTETPLFVQVVP